MARTARSETIANARAKLFTSGRSQAVRLPREFRFEGKEVAIRKEGDAVILEPLAKRKWPAGYWQRIDRRAKDLDLGRIVPIGGHPSDASPRGGLQGLRRKIRTHIHREVMFLIPALMRG